MSDELGILKFRCIVGFVAGIEDVVVVVKYEGVDEALVSELCVGFVVGMICGGEVLWRVCGDIKEDDVFWPIVAVGGGGIG